MKTIRKILLGLLLCAGLASVSTVQVSATKTENATEASAAKSDGSADDTLPTPILNKNYADTDKQYTNVGWAFDSSDGYIYDIKYIELQYSASAKFKNAKTAKITNESSTYNVSYKKVKACNGKLYARARMLYVTGSGEKVYGPWSNSVCIELVKISKKNFPGLYKTLKSGTYQTYVGENGSDFKLKTFSYDRNQDGWLDEEEIRYIYSLDLEDPVSSLKGVGYLTSLASINLKEYTGTKADFSNNPDLCFITIERQKSKEITIISPTAKHVSIYQYTQWDKLSKVDLSACDNAVEITAYGNSQHKVTSLVLPKKKSRLRVLSISDLKCSTLNLNSYKNLEQLYLYSSDVSNVKLTKCKNLKYLYLFYCSSIKSLDLTANTKLKGVDLYKNTSLTKDHLKAPKKTKVTTNTGKWWYETDSYQDDMTRIGKY
ncbi:MAG: hypothetical protein MR016_07640 [Agathobacter sp.]|nr:hypothetical protein [Agathobacter sp.]